MKRILVPTDGSEAMASPLETARLWAGRFGGTVDGVALRPAFAEIVAPDPIVAVSVPPADWDESQFVRQARQTFDTYVSGHAGAASTFRWRGGSPIDDLSLGSLARVYDVTVLSRPGGKGSRMTAFEAALFDSGRTVLMAPPRPPASLGETVLIHWNGSTETARILALTLEVLKQAKRVHFVTVSGNGVPGPTARDMIGYLAAHGIEAGEKTVEQKRGPGEAILAEAQAIGADLLIKGAYTQSRLRQMIFGGATSHVLARAELPVLFAH
jgi:nucleotide-binding universal stress UspA family protein